LYSAKPSSSSVAICMGFFLPPPAEHLTHWVIPISLRWIGYLFRSGYHAAAATAPA
jgi:hypothetical protein